LRHRNLSTDKNKKGNIGLKWIRSKECLEIFNLIRIRTFRFIDNISIKKNRTATKKIQRCGMMYAVLFRSCSKERIPVPMSIWIQ
jgi:hypothetical protein